MVTTKKAKQRIPKTIMLAAHQAVRDLSKPDLVLYIAELLDTLRRRNLDIEWLRNFEE